MRKRKAASRRAAGWAALTLEACAAEVAAIRYRGEDLRAVGQDQLFCGRVAFQCRIDDQLPFGVEPTLDDQLCRIGA